MSATTVWVLGDQLNRRLGPLASARPGRERVLLVTSRTLVGGRRWHRQRLHLVLSAMAHFAAELRAEGFEVDHRVAPSLARGLADHCVEYDVERVVAMDPTSWGGSALLRRLEPVTVVANAQFLCPSDVFARWTAGRARSTMEDFYRWRRAETGVLMDGDEPCGGRWNFDHDNREPPPTDGRAWPPLTRFALDDLDRAVLDGPVAEARTWGAEPHGLWPVTRDQALIRLDEFVEHALPVFGPHEDAMLADEWKLAHSTLSAPLNLGLLHPGEVVAAAEAAYRRGEVPIASAEGFIRQVMGWREYVWGRYRQWMPDYRTANALDADRPLPPALTGASGTHMACLASVLGHVRDNGYAHHIERLMVLGNLGLVAGIDPWALTRWMWAGFVDGAEWAMVPNVIGMALHADGGRMATKPYAAGGAYLNRMSDHCRGCRYDPRKRTGPDACPFTTLYWDFLARNESVLAGNHRLGRQLGGMRRLKDLDAVRDRAREVLAALDEGTL